MEAPIRLLSFLLLIFSCDGAQTLGEASVDPYIIDTFTVTATNTTLNHFAAAEDGSVYIGGVDVLYHVSQDLDLLRELNLTDENEIPNINKILTIISEPVNGLITCGSGLGQTCQLRNLDSLEVEREISSLLVAPGDETTVGLVVEHTEPAVTGVRLALYVAQSVTWEERNERRPVSVKCLALEGGRGCTQPDRDDRATFTLRTVLPERFIVKYAAVFSYSGYTYFLASQIGDTDKQNPKYIIVPKLSRVCQNGMDNTISGFTEVTLGCRGSDGSLYSIAQAAQVFDDKLYAVFVKNDPGEDGEFAEFRPSNQSALCVYDMEELVAEFDAAITNCTCEDELMFRDSNNWLSNAACRSEQLMCTDEIRALLPCNTVPGAAHYPQRASSLGPLHGEVAFQQSGNSFSSILMTSLEDPTPQSIGFVGTSEGHLLKVRFGADVNAGVLYETIQLSEEPVLSDTWISDDEETIMVLMEYQLLKLSVANCSKFLTCDECIRPGTGRGDPYCGWCTLENRCTRYHECSDSDLLDRWLYPNEDTCVIITSVEPAFLPIDTDATMVNLTISHLPASDGFTYSCHFGDFTSSATIMNDTLMCQNPTQAEIPPIPEGENAVEIELSVSASGIDVNFITTTFSFFDCNRINSCGTCVTDWDCDWYIDELQCMNSGQSQGNSTIRGSQDNDTACPSVFDPADTVYVPANVDVEIEVSARNLNLTEDLSGREYECVLEGARDTPYVIEASKRPGGTPDDFTVICGSTQYTYPEDLQEKNVTLRVRWQGEDVFLDGVVQVTLYKCSVDRPDCSRCLSNLTTPSVLECFWCTSSPESCVHKSECGLNEVQDTCDAVRPVITSVFPPNGPTEGGTIVEISGFDLGKRFEDIERITLAGVVCDHTDYREMYTVGASVTCISGPSPEGIGAVMVSIRRVGPNGTNITLASEDSGDIFSYNNPVIESISPTIGPMSGGTVINITGIDLQTGRDILVMLGDLLCTTDSVPSDVISCTNMANNDSTTNITELIVFFDGNPRVADEEFTFFPDPTVADLNPKIAIKSGGNLIDVEGTNFHVIQRPQILFTAGEDQATGDCQTDTSGEMVCRSPRLNSLRAKRAEDEGIEVSVGFIMDGVTELLDWSTENREMFLVVSDPSYQVFQDEVIQYVGGSGVITLGGTNLNLGSRAEDVAVFIGKENCSIVTIKSTELLCSPPPESPPPGDVYGGRTERGLPFVVVQHASLTFDIGYIEYVNPSEVILLIALPAIAILLIVAFLLLVYMWHIRRQKAKKINDLELQVRGIQDTVSDNLKSLFATLQTTAENFEAVLSEMRNIPLLSRRQYLLNMLFLGLGTEPSTEPDEEVSESPNIKAAMGKFASSLLAKKNFLEVLIRTIDQNPNIGSMEKVNIASLVSVCLLQDGKQELLTTVIFDLMREQIGDCDSNDQKCRILFSRSETILEKLLSNWVTVFQYRYLEDHAAMPLYRLFHAIKYVCEMGPIDAVTGQSQFSINDQQMLETQINFNELSLSIIPNRGTDETVAISALDVNTVTQVKERIISFLYKDSPYSEQPDPYEYDLMWRTGKGGQLILRDDGDLPGNTENEWRKLNTMGDFNVTPEHSNFELVERQENPNSATFTIQQNDYETPGQGEATTNGGNRRYEAVALRHTSFNAASFPPGVRPWHLVKEKDVEDDDDAHTKHREIKEVVLPFLPATRNYIQKYVDGFLDAVMADQSDEIAPSIKFLFQFFDREGEKLERPDFAKAWKDNVFTLRYWTTILANPQYALDLGIHSYTSASLRILVQVVKDTCAGRSKPIKTDFSPSRLLYSSFIPGYISKLTNFYLHVRDLGRVTSEDMVRECQRVEQDFNGLFDLPSTQYELYKILETHKNMLTQALEEDDVCQEADMAGKLEAIGEQISGE